MRLALPAFVLSILAISSLWLTAGFYEPSWSFNWSGIRPEIRDTVNSLTVFPMIYRGLGSGHRSNHRFIATLQREKWLMTHASIDELSRLLHFPNGKIKTLACRELIARDLGNDYEWLRQLMTDTTYYVDIQGQYNSWAHYVGIYLLEDVYSLRLGNWAIPPPAPTPEPIRLATYELDSIRLAYRQLKNWEIARIMRHRPH